MADGAIESIGASSTDRSSGSTFHFNSYEPTKGRDPKKIDIGNFLNGTKAQACYG